MRKLKEKHKKIITRCHLVAIVQDAGSVFSITFQKICNNFIKGNVIMRHKHVGGNDIKAKFKI